MTSPTYLGNNPRSPRREAALPRTHILVWLYQDGAARLTAPAVRAIEDAGQLLISPMVELELTYLQEIARINCKASDILDSLRRDIGLEASKQAE